jgi:hypothetical protein
MTRSRWCFIGEGRGRSVWQGRWSGRGLMALDSSLTPLMTASTQIRETVKKLRMGVEETGADPAGCAIVLHLVAGDRPAASCSCDVLAVAAFGLRERACAFSSLGRGEILQVDPTNVREGVCECVICRLR